MEHIRDRGNSERRAEQIQNVVQFLGQMSARPVLPHHDVKSADIGVCPDGNYHDPSLRLEK